MARKWEPADKEPIAVRVYPLEVLDERMASLRLIADVPAPGTGTREMVELLLASDKDPLLEASLESV